MQFEVLGWPADDPTLRLDFRTFSYAGKFVMSNTGKAVVRTDDPVLDPPAFDANDRSLDSAPSIDPEVFEDDVLAAVAFNEDRTDPGVCWLRYVTVHEAYRGTGLGPALASFVTDRAKEREFRRVRIAVNNPFAYQALYKAGFVFTGRETGMAELVLEHPGERDRATYQCGFDVFRERDLSDEEETYLAEKRRTDPPALIDRDALLDEIDDPSANSSSGSIADSDANSSAHSNTDSGGEGSDVIAAEPEPDAPGRP